VSESKETYLVLQAQAGSEQAFAVLYRSYHASLLRFAYRLCKNEQLAFDAVQDAWITIARTLEDLYEPSMFRARVFKAVRWRTIDLLRKQTVITVPFDEDTQVAATSGGVQWATAGQITALIARLPEVEQQAVHLFYLEELTLSEISAVLDVPVGTLKSRLNRARAHLKEIIEGEENGND